MTGAEPNIDVRWATGPEFAQAAEALGVRTDQIIAVGEQPGMPELMSALYTPHMLEDPDLDDENQTAVYQAVLLPNSDGILVLCGEPVVMPDFWSTFMPPDM